MNAASDDTEFISCMRMSHVAIEVRDWAFCAKVHGPSAGPPVATESAIGSLVL